MNKKIILFVLVFFIVILNKKTKESFQQISISSGMISIWNGNINEIPSGWVLCDGNNGTPDLRGRFVLGVNPSTNKSYIANQIEGIRELNTTGGEESHLLTVDEIPSHFHESGGQCYQKCDRGNWPTFLVDSDREANLGRPVTLSTGGSQPHNNMPPYYVLAYIMKI
jgi:microcystin-dependent protein